MACGVARETAFTLLRSNEAMQGRETVRMTDSHDDTPPLPPEPDMLSLWKKVLPRLAHYFSYPEPASARDYDSSDQHGSRRGKQRREPVLTAKPDGEPGGGA